MAQASFEREWRPVSRQNGVQLAASFSFFMLTAALILIAKNSPARGYELSLYGSLPAATWVCCALALIFGTGIIVSEALNAERSSRWYLGLLVITLTNVTILSLPIARGYYLIAVSDPSGQLDSIRTIVSTGAIDPTNFYPFLHVLGAQLVEVSGIDVATVGSLLPILFTLLSSVFIYLLASAVSCKRSHALLAAAAGTTLLYSYYHVSPYPQVAALFMFPLAFYLYFKVLRERTSGFTAAFIILVLALPFTHPAPEVVFIFCLLGVGVLLRTRSRSDASASVERVRKGSLNMALVSALLFAAWISSFAAFSNIASKFTRWLSGNIAEVPRSSEFAIVATLNLPERVLLLLKMYGDQFIFLLLSLVALIIIVREHRRHRSDTHCLLILAAFALISGPVYIIIFWSLGLITLGRFVGANTVLWVLPVFGALALAQIGETRRLSRPVAVGLITVVLVSASLLGIFTVYRSPWIDQPNTQMTHMEYSGQQWVREYALTTTPLAYLGTPAGYHYIDVPPHFGYPGNSTVASALQQYHGTYPLVLTSTEIQLAANDPVLSTHNMAPLGLSGQGFTADELARLSHDPTVNKIYGNGEFNVSQVAV